MESESITEPMQTFAQQTSCITKKLTQLPFKPVNMYDFVLGVQDLQQQPLQIKEHTQLLLAKCA